MSKIYRPDYKGGSIVNLMATIAARYGHNTGHPQLKGLSSSDLKPFRKVILLVLDGMGYNYLQKQGKGSWLYENLYCRMTSVFPSTTASCITTFATGQPPCRHAITGWFVHLKELGVISKILFCEPRFGGNKFPEAGVDMKEIIRSPAISDMLKTKSYLITPGFIADGPFSRATRGKAVTLPYGEMQGLFRMMKKAVGQHDAESFIYAYWPEFDHLCHKHGVGSPRVKSHFRQLDRALSEFWEPLSGGDTMMLVTADHGLTDTPRDKAIELDDNPELSACLSLPLSGEPRVAYCYVHPDRVTLFKKYIGRRLGKKCRIYSRKKMLSLGLYGQGPCDPRLTHRIGDFVLIMEDGYCLKDFLPTEDKVFLKANHGGLTSREMLVPLIAAK